MKTASKPSIPFWSFVTVILGILCLPTTAEVQDTLKKSFSVGAGGTLIVDVDRGSIDITTGSGNELRVEVIRKANSLSRARAESILKEHKVELKQEGNNVRIYSRYRIGRSWSIWGWRRAGLSVRYAISTPRQYNADLATAGGSISTSDLDGQVKARTSGGSLKFGRMLGPIWGRTSGGSITVQACKHSVDVESSGGGLKIGEVEGSVVGRTSGGSIEISRVTGNVMARTSGGSIRVNEVLGKIDASTSGGSVNARLSSQPEGDCTLKTSGGSIEVQLPERIAVNLDASTSGGRVITDFPVTVQGELRKNALKSKLNGGGPALVLHTSGGNVHIRRL
ncbi:MAG: DUF4097 family beta strand repeat protein [Verrucomicrobia bacterium]|nr:DUF4097 family beta strand repeat protein [Verrucomicrobiota bacterium]